VTVTVWGRGGGHLPGSWPGLVTVTVWIKDFVTERGAVTVIVMAGGGGGFDGGIVTVFVDAADDAEMVTVTVGVEREHGQHSTSRAAKAPRRLQLAEAESTRSAARQDFMGAIVLYQVDEVKGGLRARTWWLHCHINSPSRTLSKKKSLSYRYVLQNFKTLALDVKGMKVSRGRDHHCYLGNYLTWIQRDAECRGRRAALTKGSLDFPSLGMGGGVRIESDFVNV